MVTTARLDDLVLQGCDAERPLPAVRLRYVPSPGWQRPVRPCMKAPVQVGEIGLADPARSLPTSPRRCPAPLLRFRAKNAAPKSINVDVVQERRQLLLAVPVDGFSYAGPAPGTRLPGSASGPCFAVPHSRRPRRFPPSAPQRLSPLCSPASSVLWTGLTSPAPCITVVGSLPSPCGLSFGNGRRTGDLSVPDQETCAHARV